MYTPTWFLVLELSLATAVAGVLLARFVLRVPWGHAILAALLFSSFPPLTPGVYRTPLFFPDLLMPFLLTYLVFYRFYPWARPGFLPFLCIWILPGLATIGGKLLGESPLHAWITYLYRDAVLLVCYLSGVSIGSRSRDTTSFFDAGLICWIMLMCVGIAQQYGIINTDLYWRAEAGWAATVEAGETAMRGFMGYIRSSAGMMGASWALFAAAQLFLGGSTGKRLWLYSLALVLGILTVLLAGSRTSLLAGIVGAGFIGLTIVFRSSRARIGRAIAVASIGTVVLVAFLAPGLIALQERFSIPQASKSVTGRVDTQIRVIKTVFSSPRAVIMGMGGGVSQAEFRQMGGLTHSHSEYLQVLWDSGCVTFALYVAFLIAIYVRMGTRLRTPDAFSLSVGGRAMWIAGAIAALATGNVVVVAARMFTFSALMLLTYGFLIAQLRRMECEARARRGIMNRASGFDTTG